MHHMNSVSVLRGGEQVQIKTSSILVGDIILLFPGDIVRADGVLIRGGRLSVDESSLTG